MAGKGDDKEFDPDKFDWLRYREFQTENDQPGFLDFMMKNPLVPLGTAVTVGALGTGLWNLYTRNTKMQQKMMRLRVAGQGFTVVALVGGLFYHAANKTP